jgi:hypothetical protein
MRQKYMINANLAPRTDLLPGSPCRPPDWRWERAVQLARRDDRRRHWDDDWVARARRVLAALGRDGDHLADARPVRRRNSGVQGDPSVLGAHRLRNGDAIRRSGLEARLLANQGAGQIADRVGVAADVVEAYERLFYDVRGRLGCTDWIHAVAIGPGLYEAAGAGNLEALWKAWAYHGGPPVIDALLASSSGTTGDDSTSAIEPHTSRMFELAVAVTSLHVTPANAAGLVRLHDLARRIEREEAFRNVAAVTRPIVPVSIEVTIGAGSSEVVRASCAPDVREMPGIHDMSHPLVALPDGSDAEGRCLRSTG